MRTFKHLWLLILFCCLGLATNAQTQCGVTAYYYVTLNPNNVPVFHDTAQLLSGWQINSWQWDFGDGSTSTQQSPSHPYAQPGNYTVCEVVTAQQIGTGNICVDTFCTTYSNCTGMVVATFTYSQPGNGVVNFVGNGSSNYPPLTYTWTFGDGSSGTGTNPVHTYTANGTYAVCLTVTDSNGCHAQYCQNIAITLPITCGNANASFTTSGNSNAFILYSNSTGINNQTQYQWWMDGQSLGAPSASNNPYTVLPTAGTHTFCLYLYAGSSLFCDSTCQTITVAAGSPCGNAVANFTHTQTAGVVALQSSSTGTNANTLYQWWMDGQALTNPNPNTGYTVSGVTAGTHTFCLYIYANSNTFCDSACQTFFVPGTNVCSGIQANFTATAGAGSISVAVANTYPTGTYYHWWLDGSNTANGPTYQQFTWNNLTVGQHRVCLYVYGNQSTFCDSICQYITVTSPAPCNVNAGWQYTASQPPAVQFYGASNPNGTIYHWTFGDGTTYNATTSTTTHTYPSSATTVTYQVCLIAYVSGTICTDTFCQYVVVPGQGSNCQAYYVATTSGGLAAFTNSSSLGGASSATYNWSFGDGTSSTAASPTHTYTSPGNYLVCLSIATSAGCTSQYCDTVTIQSPCSLSVSITSAGTGPTYVLTAHASGGTGGPYAYYWNNSTTSTVTVTQPGTYCVSVFDANQCVGTACYTVNTPALNDTLCGIVFNDANGNGVQDNGEQGISGVTVYAGNYSAVTDANGHYNIYVPAGTYYIHYCAAQGNTITLPVSASNNSGALSCGYYAPVSISGFQHLCGFDFGVQNNSVNICGTVYFDANNNHQQDTTETGISGVHVTLAGSNGHTYQAYTDAQGHYCVLVPIGTYTITMASTNFSTCSVTPQTLTVTATTPGQVSNQDFAVYCQPGACNLAINITPHTTVTAGFPAWYDIQVCNLGSSVASGTVNLFYDQTLTFNYSSPAQTSHNASTHTLSWALNNLMPGDCEYYWVTFNANSGLTLNQFVFTLANVVPGNGCNDVNLNNNVDTVHQVVTGSWDPNNKLAYVTNVENPSYQMVSSVEPNQRIEYVINFQNQGNANAVNVVIKDVISSDLDISSFEFLGASHPCAVTEDNGEMNFKFSDIQLPAEMTNEPASHGWVKFAINANNGLLPGYVISDDAAIYFDYNTPVVTNDAAVTLIDATGIEELTPSVNVVIAPNPMTDYAEIRIAGKNTDGAKLRVYDITGRLVTEQTFTSNALQLERNNLAAGVYTYQILQNNKPLAKGKLVME